MDETELDREILGHRGTGRGCDEVGVTRGLTRNLCGLSKDGVPEMGPRRTVDLTRRGNI